MRAALSRARKGRPITEEHRAALSAAHKSWWENATDEERAARPYPRGPWNRSDTRIELLVAAALDALGETYAAQHRIGRWVPDFVLEERRLVIEWRNRQDLWIGFLSVDHATAS